MAGSLAIVSTESPVDANGGLWKIEYSRFINYFCASSTPANLIPLSKNYINRFKGFWISSSSAILQLLPHPSTSQSIFLVSVGENFLEEHFLEKIQFSWPQVSCVSGFPSRGSRVVFASYISSENQIQKFGLRLSSPSEAKMFIDSVKDAIHDAKVVGVSGSQLGSEKEIAQSEVPATSRTPLRSGEESSILDPTETRIEQESVLEETAYHPALPRSFNSLLTSCGDEAQISLPEDANLQARVKEFMEDSDFLDMMNKVEKVIGEMGYRGIGKIKTYSGPYTFRCAGCGKCSGVW